MTSGILIETNDKIIVSDGQSSPDWNVHSNWQSLYMFIQDISQEIILRQWDDPLPARDDFVCVCYLYMIYTLP